jgi:hypothetical protein
MTGKNLVRLGGVLALLVTAGCGSTVQGAGLQQAGPGGQSLSVPTSGNAAPGAAAGAATVGGATPGGVAAVDGGTGAGGAGGSGAAGQAAGGGQSGGGAVTQAGNGPGITATTINIGEAYNPEVSSADAAIGAANANPGDIKAETSAVISYINAHGGVAHRKLNPIWYRQSLNDSAAQTFQNECSYWTQDHKVFVMEAEGPILANCVAKEQAISLTAGAIVADTNARNRQYPADINVSSFTIDHSMTATVNGLAKQGYFTKGAKVGLVTWDDADYRTSIQSGAYPALAAIGLTKVPTEYIAAPASYGDLSQTSAAVGSAVLKYQTMGIDHVIIFDGPAGVAQGAILFLEWMQQANSQHYYPKYGLNTTSGFNALASDVPQQELVGSIGIGWMPSLEETSQDFARTPLRGYGKLCLQIMKNAGQQQSGANAIAVQLGICDRLFFLKQVLDPLTGPINQQTALAAINAIGNRFQSSITFGLTLTAQKHDAARDVRNMAYLQSCQCYRYTSAPYNPF